MLSELRRAGRTLARTPGFTITVILVLTLGIGANTTIFSLLNSVLFHPAGISEPDRIVAIRVKYGKIALRSIGTSAPDFADIRDRKDVFSSAAAMSQADYNYTGGDLPVRLQGAQVSWQFFDVFGVPPRLGRVFRADEDVPGTNRVVILSDAIWKRMFGANPGIIGQTIQLNQEPYQVAGVMGPDFRFPARADLWTPLAIDPKRFTPDNRHNQWLFTAARLQPGLTIEQADAAAKVLTQQILEREDKNGYGRNSDWGIFATPFLTFITGDTRTPLLILMGAVGFVLLIACSNIAGLMLARASHRTREYSVRVALGASAWHIVRHTMAESLTLSGLGAVFGLIAGILGSKLLLVLAPASISEGVVVHTDYRVLLFTVAAAVISAILFGIAPAIQLVRTDHHLALREGGRGGTAGKARQRVRSALVIAEFALALVLMVGSGLLIRSLVRMTSVATGFDPRGVLTAQLTLPETHYKEAARQAAFYRDALEHMAALPGVKAAAACVPLPFSGDNWSASFRITGKPLGQGQVPPHGDVRRVTPRYFEAMGIPLVRGRFFTDLDRDGSERVAIIDELLARQYWPNEDPIGQQIEQDPRYPARIVGIVRHIRHTDLIGEEKKGAYYYPLYQRPVPMAALIVKAAGGDSAVLAAGVRDAVRSVDPAQPVHTVKTLENLVEASLANRRLAVILLAIFASLALLLSAIGIYGVISYSVTQRTPEIGIRVALGASRRAVLGMVLRQGTVLAAAGIIIGVAGAAALSSLLRTQLFEVSAFDPATFAGMAAVLAAISILATYVPARRALRIDPSEALRYE